TAMWSPGIHSPRYESGRLIAWARHGSIRGMYQPSRHPGAQELRHAGGLLGSYRLPTQFAFQLLDALACEQQLPELVPLANYLFQLVVAHGKALPSDPNS